MDLQLELQGVFLARQNIDARPIVDRVERSNGAKYSARRVKSYLKRLCVKWMNAFSYHEVLEWCCSESADVRRRPSA